jgi:hypothetical protein
MRESRRHEYSNTAPKNGINIQLEFVSGTTGAGLGLTAVGGTADMTCACAKAGIIKVAATKAQTLPTRL